MINHPRVAAVSLVVLATAILLYAQAGSDGEPVRYTGSVIIEKTNSAHDGMLRPAIGVENIQVLRANRSHPEMADGHGWTYNHAANLAYWNGKFYYHYLSNPVGEHIAPGQTLVATSADGRNWSKPVVVFPPYKLAEGGTAMMHQRSGFYVARKGRLLVTGFYGHAPNPFGKGGIGRVIREAYKDGKFGPIYFIRYNRQAGFNESNTTYPYYTKATDKGFLAACEHLLANKLVTLNWWQEEQSNDDNFYAVTGNLQAFNYYHRKDGKVVGLWKWSLAAISPDEGKSWSTPAKVPTLIMDGAKQWGQHTEDSRYALFYNPINDSTHRWPLAVISSDDGISFDNMLAVHGEVPPRRFEGKYKDFGPQYMRGIPETDGNPPGTDVWLAYSVNKEDMWITRIPVPVRGSVSGPVNDNFNSVAPGGAVPGWNIYRPQWAPVAVANFPGGGNRSLELQDRDPYDYAKAVRVFAEAKQVSVRFRAYARQNEGGELQIEVTGAQGSRPVRLVFAEDGKLKAAAQEIASYKPNTWYTVAIDVDATNGKFSVSLDGKPVLRQAAFAEPASTVERLVFRTGAFRTEPTRETSYTGPRDQPNADQPVRAATFYIDDVSTTSK